jgi:hypothetical protein
LVCRPRLLLPAPRPALRSAPTRAERIGSTDRDGASVLAGIIGGGRWQWGVKQQRRVDQQPVFRSGHGQFFLTYQAFIGFSNFIGRDLLVCCNK